MTEHSGQSPAADKRATTPTRPQRESLEREVPLAALPFVWPLRFAGAMNQSASSLLNWYAGLFDGARNEAPAVEPHWTTPNAVVLELPTLRLRDVSTDEIGQPTLICAPYALHGATIVDFAPGHSIVEALQKAGVTRLAVTDWRSATAEMRHFSIDTYLADLNVAVDELGPPVDLIGLCQGGWMALVYAARFPEKVRRLVLVGAPVDVRAAQSRLSRAVDEFPLDAFENLVRLGDGRVLGRHALSLWGSSSDATNVHHVLQISRDDPHFDALERRFAEWYQWTLDLPGTYYMQVVERVFRENQIADGCFMALGRVADIRALRKPMYLLCAQDDEVVAPGQLFAAAGLTATPESCIEKDTAPCGHLGLFMSADTMSSAWPRIARWLSRDLRPDENYEPAPSDHEKAVKARGAATPEQAG
jgi:poly(3-hydroxyalkanoate) synthetase